MSDLASGTPITPGTAVSGTLNPGNSTSIYKFNANAGDLIYFDEQGLSGGSDYYNTNWRLIGPNGQQVWFDDGFGDVGTQAMPSTGTYTLLVEGDVYDTSPVSYSFNVQNLTQTAVPLTLGSQVSGSILQPSADSFTLANPAHLYFDSLTSDGTLNWSLIGPTGTLVNQLSFTSSDGINFSSDPVLNLNTGRYFSLRAVGGSTNYAFRLLDLASATPITPGTAVSGSLNPGNSTSIYKFNANAGDLFYFDEQSLSGGSGSYYYDTNWRLIDPTGQQVWFDDGFSSVGTQALASTGTYTLLVEGYVYNTSPVSYSFNTQKVTNTTAALTVGATVNGAITQAGQQNFYTFTLANASQLYFDSLTNDGSLYWTLTGPRGTEVSSRSFTGSDSSAISGDPVLN